MAQRSPGSADAAIATRRFRVCGMVQGVGFRPFVHKLAQASGAHGWVLNDSSGVLIELQATQSAIDGFIADLLARPPPLARLVDLRDEPGVTTVSTSARRSATPPLTRWSPRTRRSALIVLPI